MRKRSVAVVVASVIVFLTTASGANSAPSTTGALEGPVAASELAAAVRLHPPKPTSVIDTVVALVNEERAVWGLAPLTADSRLHSAAQGHSDYQASTGAMSHTGSGGSTAGQRIAAAGFPWRSCAENVAYGYSSAEAVVAAWMNSTGHRNNILSANTHVGVGLAYSGSGTPYWTLVFATPP